MKAVLILGVVLGISFLIFGLWLLLLIPLAAIFMILVSAVCFGYWIMALQTALAQFVFSEEGVRVKYPMEKEHFFPWEAFLQVCVCYYSRATEMAMTTLPRII